MKIEYINPFLEASVYVLEQFMQGVSIDKNKLGVISEPLASLGVAALVGLTGQLKGRVIYDMTQETALQVVSKMNFEEFNEFNELARSTINELSNMITGTAVAKLSGLGYKFDLTPPSLFTGQKVIITDAMHLKHLVVPVNTPCGNIILNLGLTDK